VWGYEVPVLIRRLLLVTLVGLTLAQGTARAAGGPVAGAGVPVVKVPAPSAKLVSCQSGEDGAARLAVFSATMAAASVPQTKRMAMRFTLLEQTPETAVPAPTLVPGWGAWERAEAGRPGFVVTKRVDGLIPGDTYLASVLLRWIGKGGKVLRTVKLTTRPCVEVDSRPDLVVGALGGRRTPTGATYDLVVRNRGAQPAGPFGVAMTIGDAPIVTALAPPLNAGAETSVTLRGAACEPGSMVRVTLDPGQVVDEVNEADAVVLRRCPLGAL
jgi:hypothetical protein